MAEPVPAGEAGGPPKGKRPIGSLFVEKGMVTPAQLDEALARQKGTGDRLGEVLVELGYVSRIELASAIGDQLVELRLLQGGSGQQAGAPVAPAPAAPVAAAPAAPDRSVELQAEIDLRDKRLANQSQSIDELLDKINALEKQLREQAHAEPDPALAELAAERDTLAARVEELERELAEAAAAPAPEAGDDPGGEREGLLAAIAEHGWRVGELEAELGARTAAAAQLQTRVEELQILVAERESSLAREASAAAATRGRIAALEAQLRELEGSMDEPAFEDRVDEPEPDEPAPAVGHVLCISGPSGFKILAAVGEPPAVGDAVSPPEMDEAYVVVRIGSSPLPDDPRPCAFVEPPS